MRDLFPLDLDKIFKAKVIALEFRAVLATGKACLHVQRLVGDREALCITNSWEFPSEMVSAI